MNLTTLYFEITNKCNFNCSTCYNRSGLNRILLELQPEIIKKTINTFIPFGLKRVVFSGGEPTLHSNFIEILGLIKKYEYLEFAIVTNGSCDDYNIILAFNTLSGITIQISLDGANEEINKLTRGKHNFHKTINFIENMSNSKITRLLKIVVTHKNYHQIEDFYSLALKLKCIPEFAFMFKSGNASINWEENSLTITEKLKVVETVSFLNKKFGINSFVPTASHTCPLLETSEPLSLSIKSNGSIQPCQVLYEQLFSIGNIYDLNIKELEKNILQLRATLKKRINIDYGCKQCILKNVCKKGCPAEAYLIHEDLLACDNACLLRKAMFVKTNLLINNNKIKNRELSFTNQ